MSCTKCICEKDRPATESDIADMQENLAAVASDPNMRVVLRNEICICECHPDSEWMTYCREQYKKLKTSSW